MKQFLIATGFIFLAAGCSTGKQHQQAGEHVPPSSIRTDQVSTRGLADQTFTNLPKDVFPEQVNSEGTAATYPVDGHLYAFALEPNMNFFLPHLNGKAILWHGVLRSSDNGQHWRKFFTIIDPQEFDRSGGIRYNPVGVFAENRGLYVDIANDRGAGSGEGELIRFLSLDDGQTWNREACYYFMPKNYYLNYDYFVNGLANTTTPRPHNLRPTTKCVY